MQGLYTIDCEYLLPEYAASYLVVEGGRAAFVENNTVHAVPKLLRTLEAAGLQRSDVDYVVITHVHLDHAGGTSSLMQACPNATLLAHPRAARHMKDPTKLVAGAKAVYGEERFRTLYGNLDPVPTDRVREMADGEILRWGNREWLFLHTRGHAKHHFCLWDSHLRGSFTGDSFGIFYPSLQKNGLFIFPSTSPTDFEAGEARKSIERMAALEGDRAFLTHFGTLSGLQAARAELLAWIDFSEGLVEEAVHSSLSDAELNGFCGKAVDARFRHEMEVRALMNPQSWELTRLDRELNASGLAHVAVQRRRENE